jgi:hypothetical protein
VVVASAEVLLSRGQIVLDSKPPRNPAWLNRTHLIIGEHATQEGSYVALTRARERTDIYASLDRLGVDEEGDELAKLAEQIAQREDEMPSIDTPLEHEAATETAYKLETRNLHSEATVA